jgi:hypothetical protein
MEDRIFANPEVAGSNPGEPLFAAFRRDLGAALCDYSVSERRPWLLGTVAVFLST